MHLLFEETFNCFSSLYGNDLPVQCMNISSDRALLCFGSNDKYIQIRGMDIGDYLKSTLTVLTVIGS